MSYVDFYDKLNSMDDKEYIEKMLVYSLSPVIAGVKPASTITFNKKGQSKYNLWINYGVDFIRSINLEFVDLRENNDSIVIMIYNKAVLQKCLLNDESRKFLMKIGYSEIENFYYCINMLKFRYSLYHCPHELGLFLGIPIKDVVDFMECTDKKCLLCGYWKVYNDCNNAKETFKRLDTIKNRTMQYIIEGEKSVDLVNIIKDGFCEKYYC